ncbi:RNA recognition motif domain-containing protein [Candidatus Margulisiibacteriota bacterium]
MTKTLYVGNMLWTTKEDEITASFEAHGEVISARIVTDKVTGKSKGFGFVEVNDEDAPKMVKTMNGFNLGGREIIVNEARPKRQSPSTGRGAPGQPEDNA